MRNAFKSYNQIFSCRSPLVLPVDVDFSVNTEQLVDLTPQIQLNYIDFISSVYVDLRNVDVDLEIVTNLVGQRVFAPRNSQGYYPLMLDGNPKLTVTASAVNADPIKLFFSNIPFYPFQSFDGGLPVTISGGSLTGGYSYSDISIASLSGASEQLVAANPDRRLLIIANIGANDIAVNLAGGAAAIGAAGSIDILAGGNLVLDANVPTNAINIIGTAAQPVTAYEA